MWVKLFIDCIIDIIRKFWKMKKMVELFWSFIFFLIVMYIEVYDGVGGRVGVGRWIVLLFFDFCKYLFYYKNR